MKRILFMLIVLSSSSFAQTKFKQNAISNENKKLYVCPNCPASGITSTDFTQNTEQLSVQYGVTIYPDSFLEKVSLTITNLSSAEQATKELVDANGKVLFVERKFQAQNKIDMSKFRQGVYYLRISVGKDIMLYKIIKT